MDSIQIPNNLLDLDAGCIRTHSVYAIWSKIFSLIKIFHSFLVYL